MTISFFDLIKKLRHPRIWLDPAKEKRSPFRRTACLFTQDWAKGFTRARPQPVGGWLIRGDVDPRPALIPLLLAIRSAIDSEPFGDEPRAVPLVVAQWLRSVGHKFAARDLEREASK